MAEKEANSLVGSPIYRFVKDCWGKFIREISISQLNENILLLAVLWTLDSIKEGDEEFICKWNEKLYLALYEWFSSNDISCSNRQIESVMHLVCAFVLSCYGLVLKESLDNQETYCKLVGGLGNDWDKVKEYLQRILVDSNTKGLQEWLLVYMESDSFYTVSDKMEWDKTTDKSLPMVNSRNKANSPLQLNVAQLYVGQLHNAGDINEYSVNINTRNDESR